MHLESRLLVESVFLIPKNEDTAATAELVTLASVDDDEAEPDEETPTA